MGTTPQELPAVANADPAINALAVTPSANNLADFSRALYIGGSGDVEVTMAGAGNVVTFTGVAAGSILPIAVKQVRAATTATNIVALY